MIELATTASRPFHNPRVEWGAYPPEFQAVVSEAAAETARRVITSWPDYAPTPLRALPQLAARLGVGGIDYKDEAGRFGLGSFKALGGAYAVFRLIQRLARERLGREIRRLHDLRAAELQPLLQTLTVCCATDGNHGRSVAWAARMFGCRCVIFLHAGVSQGREDAIRAYGAQTLRVSGNYDDSVEAAADAAARCGWHVISDTSYAGYMEVPLDVMAGYTVMVAEILGQQDAPPTHVFLQGGVGGMAAAVAAYLWLRYGADRPRIIVVEPEGADCLFQSARAGRPVRVEGALDTVMAGLACGEVSLVAWRVLERAANDFITVADAPVMRLMRDLAHGAFGDPPLVAGESAVAGLAGLQSVMRDPALAAELGLDRASRVLCFGTEGDTDPEIFQRITGTTAAAIRASAAMG